VHNIATTMPGKTNVKKPYLRL